MDLDLEDDRVVQLHHWVYARFDSIQDAIMAAKQDPNSKTAKCVSEVHHPATWDLLTSSDFGAPDAVPIGAPALEDSSEDEQDEETKTQQAIAERKKQAERKRMAEAELGELALEAERRRVEAESRASSTDEKLAKKAGELVRYAALNPKGFDDLKKESDRGMKKMGNGLPLDCTLAFFDLEVVSTTEEKGGFGESHIASIGAKAWTAFSKQDPGRDEFCVHVDPQIDWGKLRPMLRNSIKRAWGLRSLGECVTKASQLLKFPDVFVRFMIFLRQLAPKSGHILLAGFNSTASDLLALQADVQRYKLKWPEDLTIWLWNCAPLMVRTAGLTSKNWNLGLLYKTVMGSSMNGAHEAFPDACNLRRIALQLWPKWTQEQMCALLSTQDSGITVVSDPRLEAEQRLEIKKLTGMREFRDLTPEQSDAIDLGNKMIKAGVVAGLGDKHALRLKRLFGLRFMNLFEKYETDDQFVQHVLRKDAAQAMAKATEEKLLKNAKLYAVPRDKRRQKEEADTKKQAQRRADELELHKTRLAFLAEIETVLKERSETAPPLVVLEQPKPIRAGSPSVLTQTDS